LFPYPIFDERNIRKIRNALALRSRTPRVLPTHMRIDVVVAGLDVGQAAVIAAKPGEGVAVMLSDVAPVERPLRLAVRQAPFNFFFRKREAGTSCLVALCVQRALTNGGR